jgi:glycosyltransferase involved in cell wall biosynthesis
MANPLVSVIIPVYNRDYCIRRAIDSVLAQTFKDYELIVVDDGSTDKSVEVIKIYGDAVQLITQKNAGSAAARNTGVRAARGRWIAFLDSDDEWRPEKLEWQLRYLEKYQARVCYSRSVAENGQPLPDIEDIQSTVKEPGVHHVAEPMTFVTKARCHPYLQSMVLARELFDQAGFFDTALPAGEDTLWIFNLSFFADCIYLDRPMTIIHRYSDNSLSYDMRPAVAEKRFDAFIRMQQEIYRRLHTTAPEKLGLTRSRLGYFISRRAELACAAGESQRARSLAREGLPFAADLRTRLHCLAIFLAPSLCRRHFQKKWRPQTP